MIKNRNGANRNESVVSDIGGIKYVRVVVYAYEQVCVHLWAMSFLCICTYMFACVCTEMVEVDSQQRELISLLLQPHLQQALDRPTTTSRPLRSALRKASRISSEMKERAGLLNSLSRTSDGRLGSLLLRRRLSTTELSLQLSEDSSWRELNGSSERSAATKLEDEASCAKLNFKAISCVDIFFYKS